LLIASAYLEQIFREGEFAMRIVGLSVDEIANRRGFCWDYVLRLTRDPSFPAPVALVGQVGFWRATAVDRWFRERGDLRRFNPGRPRKRKR
jgi:hypothetical protein